VLRAAARAHAPPARRSRRTPTKGRWGRAARHPDREGVAPGAIVVGHSCGSSNLDYHLAMLDRGTYLGFDRFGLELLHPTGRGRRP
jgi:phosphotriesterase-related protein